MTEKYRIYSSREASFIFLSVHKKTPSPPPTRPQPSQIYIYINLSWYRTLTTHPTCEGPACSIRTVTKPTQGQPSQTPAGEESSTLQWSRRPGGQLSRNPDSDSETPFCCLLPASPRSSVLPAVLLPLWKTPLSLSLRQASSFSVLSLPSATLAVSGRRQEKDRGEEGSSSKADSFAPHLPRHPTFDLLVLLLPPDGSLRRDAQRVRRRDGGGGDQRRVVGEDGGWRRHLHHQHPRDGAGWAGERELALHHRRVRGPVHRHAGAAQPREQVGVRRRSRRRPEPAGVRGGLLQLLPLLQPGGAGPQASHQPAQQQGRGRGLPCPHQHQGPALRYAVLRSRIGTGLHLPYAVHGERDPDPAGHALVRQPGGGPGCHHARYPRDHGAPLLHLHCLLLL